MTRLQEYAHDLYNSDSTNENELNEKELISYICFTTVSAANLSYGYAYDTREYGYALCAASQDYFDILFTDDTVRDLWNNCYGRAYATEYSSYVTAFNVANNVGE